jgi:tetratricopeptide (TPR) repeat protein
LNVGDLEGELRLSCRYYEESLKLFEEIGDLGKIAYSLGALGIQYQSMGDTDAACRSWERCLAIQRELNQPIPVTVAHDRLAQIHAQRGDFVAACAHVRARLSLRRELARDRGLSPPPPSEPHEGCHAPDAAMLRALWEADLALERVLEGPEGGGVPLWASIQLAKEQGDFRVAEAHLDTIEAVARRHEARWPEQGTLLRRAEIAQARGDFDAARRWLDMGFTVARGVGNPRLERDLRGFQGILASAQGDTEEARPLLADRAEDYRRQQYWRTLAYWLSLLGLNALRAGELPAARAHLDESRSLLEVATDHELRGSVLAVAGRLCLAEGDPASARSLFEESLAIRRPRRARPGGLECLEGLAAVEAAIGCRELAARTFSACAAERQALGTPIPPADRPAHERRVAALRAALGDAAFVAAWEAGRRLTLEAVWS